MLSLAACCFAHCLSSSFLCLFLQLQSVLFTLINIPACYSSIVLLVCPWIPSCDKPKDLQWLLRVWVGWGPRAPGLPSSIILVTRKGQGNSRLSNPLHWWFSKSCLPCAGELLSHFSSFYSLFLIYLEKGQPGNFYERLIFSSEE